MIGALVAMVVAAVPAVARAADHAVGFPMGALPAPYSPAAVEANPGDTVTFSGAFSSHPLVWNTGDFATTSTGTSAPFPFAHPGMFRFHCQIHASMTGSVHVAGNQFATPDFTWAPSSPQAGQAVTFSATAFADPDGTIARYEWDLDGDGSFESTGAQVVHTYANPATASVALRYVDDGHEASPTTVHAVTVRGAPGGGGGGTGGGTAPGGGAGGAGGTPAAPAPGGGNPPTPPPGGGDQGAGPGSGDPALSGIRLSTRALTFRRGAATVSVSVTAPATARVTLRQGVTVLAAGTARVRPGVGHVRVKLTRAGARRLRRARTVRASLAAVVRESPGAVATVRRTVTVRLAR